MHINSECRKIKRSTCAIPIQAAIICNSLPRQGVSNGLVIVKLKWGLKWRGHLYFEPVCLFKVTISSTRIFLLQRSFRWGYVKVFWYQWWNSRRKWYWLWNRICFSWRATKYEQDCNKWGNSNFWNSEYNQ